jgi:hypothetical protein
MTQGYVYIVSNRSIPGKLKIGQTTRSIKERLAELSNTSVPTAFELELSCSVHDAVISEKIIHQHFQLKYKKEKEFFIVKLPEAVKHIKLLVESGSFEVINITGRAKSLFLTDSEQSELNKATEKANEVANTRKRERENLKKYLEAKEVDLFNASIKLSKSLQKFPEVYKGGVLSLRAPHEIISDNAKKIANKKFTKTDRDALHNFLTVLAEIKTEYRVGVMKGVVKRWSDQGFSYASTHALTRGSTHQILYEDGTYEYRYILNAAIRGYSEGLGLESLWAKASYLT